MSSRRFPWRDLVALGVVAVAMRIGASLLVSDPAYLDAAYYELVARRLEAGDGFTVPVVWSYLETGGVLPADPTLPVASNRHWMPLTALVSAGSMGLLGSSRFAAELPHAILGSLLVPATAWVGWWLWASRRLALLAGVLALFPGPMLVYVPMVDSFALFGACGFASLAAAIRATAPGRSGWWIVGSGMAVGLATLTRIDGAFLAVAPATAWLARRGVGPWRVEGAPMGVGWAFLAALAGLAVLAPWLARQAAEFGSMLPSAGGRLLWITEYNEQFSVTGDPTIGSYLASGLPAILGAKLEAFVLLLGRTSVLLGGAFVVPFFYGLWRERRRAELAPFAVYWIVLFAAMVLLFTFHGPAGAWYHSAWAWLPFAIPLAVTSGAPLLEALGRHLRTFGRPRNRRFLGVAALAGAVLLSLVGSAALIAQWRRDASTVASAAAYLSDHATGDEVVMYVDPPSLHLLTGLSVVPPPFDPPDVVYRAAQAYDVAWVVVERAAGAQRDALGLWDGAAWLTSAPAFDGGDIRIYSRR